jgi:CRP/FNR family cyclic AMP-dependent transcriptional regulator
MLDGQAASTNVATAILLFIFILSPTCPIASCFEESHGAESAIGTIYNVSVRKSAPARSLPQSACPDCKVLYKLVMSVAPPTFFERLPVALRRKLERAGQIHLYQDRQTIHQRGDVNACLSIVKKGRVRIHAIGIDGDDVTVAIVSPGQTYGELTIFAHLPRAHDAEAIGRTEVIEIGSAAFDNLMIASDVLRRSVLENLAVLAAAAAHRIEEDRRLPLVSRVARTLLELAVKTDEGSLLVDFTQRALAEYIGVSRMSVSSCLADFQRKRILSTGYARIRILRVAPLRRLLESRVGGTVVRSTG